MYSKKKKRFVGLIDMADFVAFFTSHFSEDVLKNDNVEKFLSVQDRFTTLLVANVSNTSTRNPWYPVDKSAPVSRVLDSCCRNNIHRIPILDHDGELVSLVSQTDVLEYVASLIHSPLLQGLAHTKIEEGHIGSFGEVHSVSSDEPALTAFQLISEKRVHGVAVVDKAGRLVSNISASDLRVVHETGFSLGALYASSGDFVKAASAGSALRGARGAAALSLRRDATFAEALLALHDARTHRAYVVDEHGKPVGVVSQIDLIRAVNALAK